MVMTIGICNGEIGDARRVSEASETVTRVERLIDAADTALKADRLYNGYGIYRDRASVLGQLILARKSIEDAITTLSRDDWPNLADYNAVDEESR
jgi:hypothetical protein